LSRKKKILFGVKKVKISLQSTKTEFGAQNKYGRVIYPSIENFTCSKKKYTFGGQKGEYFRAQKQNFNLKILEINFCAKNP
jgi:5-hydroxyisourate hydrolase-like protein (transthyretin family)